METLELFCEFYELSNKMNPDQFIFRNASNSDSYKIIDLVKKILSEFNLTYSPESSENDLLDIEKTYFQNGGFFEVIENKEKEIIGTVAVLKVNNNRCKLRKMYVDKKFRGIGLGKVLLKRMLLKAKELGYNEIILETVNNMTAAIRLYQEYGFNKVDNNNADSPRCDTVMIKEIIN